MAEPIIEQIAAWISTALNNVSDPDGTLTLRAVRPKILEWDEESMLNNDVVIEMKGLKTESYTNTSRTEMAVFRLEGIIRELPADTKAGTVLNRMSETIKKTIHAGNTLSTACGGLATSINCAELVYDEFPGGVCVIILCDVLYNTNIKDGYIQA